MSRRVTIIASAVLLSLIAVLAVSLRAAHAQAAAAAPAADDCLAKPGATAPKGSHWYYRIDRSSNRRCWYLGAEDAKARQARAPKPQPASKAAAPCCQPRHSSGRRMHRTLNSACSMNS